MPEQHMVFSTHLDDDIIFMNNDIYDAIEGGEPVTSVYLVTSNPDRELGIKAAYSVMAGADDWVDETVVVGGQTIASSYLESNPDVRTYFLRFPDQGSGNSTTQQLYDGAVSSVITDDGVSYTRDQLTETLTGLMDLHQPDNIMKHGAEIAANGGDHGEHIHFNEFVEDALEDYSTSHDVDDYLGYAVANLNANVTDGELARKVEVFEAYGQYDTNALNIPVFRDWLERQYQVGPDGQPVEEDWDIRGDQTPPVDEDPTPPPPQTGIQAVSDTFEVQEGGPRLIGNVLDNDSGEGMRVINGFKGYVGDAYITVSRNGDVHMVEGGEFDDLADGETRTISLNYKIKDDSGERSKSTFEIEVTGTDAGTGGSDPTPGVPQPEFVDAVRDSFEVEEGGPQLVGNVLDNDSGEGIRVIRGYEGYFGDAYITVSSNGDVHMEQNGEFDNLAEGETQTIPLNYKIKDEDGLKDRTAFEIEVVGTAASTTPTTPTPPTMPDPTVPTVPEDGPNAVDDNFVVDEDSWAVIGNVLENDTGEGARVVNGFEGFVGDAYVAVFENGDVRMSQRGEFDDLAAGETREIPIDYTIEDMFGQTDAATLNLILEGEDDTSADDLDIF